MIKPDPAIIFVPGIRPKPPVEVQQAQLRRCLQAGLTRARAKPNEVSALTNAFTVIGWSHQFYGAHGDITPDLPGIERLLANVGDATEDSREALSIGRKITSIFYALADRFPLLTNVFATRRMETRVEEINRYFDDSEGRATVARSLVAQELQRAWHDNQRVLLIGHSFGSVIAYDTLWELSRQQANPGVVDTFISMGSPLTMRYIRARLKGAGLSGAARYPANIRRWLNLAAIGEVTALDRHLQDCFADMRRLALVESIADNLALLNQFRGPDGLNVHKCFGYAASPLLGKEIIDWYRRVG